MCGDVMSIDSDVEAINRRYSMKTRGFFGKIATVAATCAAGALALSGCAGGGAGPPPAAGIVLKTRFSDLVFFFYLLNL